jgi:phage host-nuclease inhibitor protein Gam
MITITSTETLDSAAGDLVRKRIALTQAKAAMEGEMAGVEKRHEERIQTMLDDCATLERAITAYTDAHRAEVLGEKKSRETPLCVFGFRLATSVQTATKKLKWAEVIDRMMRHGAEKYLRYKEPAVNKQALLEDKDMLSEKECEKMGIRFETSDEFYLTPKPETAQNN